MSALVISTGGARALPLELLLSSIPSPPRHVLDRLVERAIDRLDEMDGDPDLEVNGDELDGDNAEDAPGLYAVPGFSLNRGPGCVISDPT